MPDANTRVDAEEYSQTMLGRILAIAQQPGQPAATRMSQITQEALRYYHTWLKSKLDANIKRVVQYGPFAGQLCTTSAVLPHTIGSYEAELHETIELLAQRNYERIVNIGCGEGYYAVGLARLLPGSRVFACESNPAALTACRGLAELNGVADRITLLGKCTPAVLQDLLGSKTLIFCDCEGDELRLLDPAVLPGLLHCDIVVEMHDFLDPTTSATLMARFQASHNARLIPQSRRDPAHYPVLASCNEFEQLFALCEFRPGPTPWALFLANPPPTR